MVGLIQFNPKKVRAFKSYWSQLKIYMYNFFTIVIPTYYKFEWYILQMYAVPDLNVGASKNSMFGLRTFPLLSFRYFEQNDLADQPEWTQGGTIVTNIHKTLWRNMLEVLLITLQSDSKLYSQTTRNVWTIENGGSLPAKWRKAFPRVVEVLHILRWELRTALKEWIGNSQPVFFENNQFVTSMDPLYNWTDAKTVR